MFYNEILSKFLSFGTAENTDISTMVSTACSSIDNQALISPHFFKTFLFMFGVYFVIYIFSKEIWNKWFEEKKVREFLFTIIIFGTLFLWSILGGGSSSSVRSGFSFAYIIHGVIIFVSVIILIYYSARFYQSKEKFKKENNKGKK